LECPESLICGVFFVVFIVNRGFKTALSQSASVTNAEIDAVLKKEKRLEEEEGDDKLAEVDQSQGLGFKKLGRYAPGQLSASSTTIEQALKNPIHVVTPRTTSGSSVSMSITVDRRKELQVHKMKRSEDDHKKKSSRKERGDRHDHRERDDRPRRKTEMETRRAQEKSPRDHRRHDMRDRSRSPRHFHGGERRRESSTIYHSRDQYEGERRRR